VALHTVSFCTGAGGLDLGLRIAGRLCGFVTRNVCYVEREAAAVETLVSRIADGIMDDAPVWSDIATFDSRCWRGKVHIITGGYPCQPFSHAGKRGGADDPRHLWPHIIKHVNTLRPLLCFFENVDGHLSLGYREVRDDLEALGYRVEAEIVSAAETGATHRRKRLFIMAYSDGWGCQQFGSSGILHSQWETLGNDTDRPGGTPVAVAADAGRGTFGVSSNGGEQGQTDGRPQSTSRSGKCCTSLADGNNQYEHRSWDTGTQRGDESTNSSGSLAGGSVFAPGPGDIGRWLDVLRHDATVAPALPVLGRRSNAEDVAAESPFCRMADGLAPWLDTLAEHRTERLQMLGNGVVPTSAALAFCVLAKRLGVTEETTWQQNTV